LEVTINWTVAQNFFHHFFSLRCYPILRLQSKTS
jgi:hypothetical protein